MPLSSRIIVAEQLGDVAPFTIGRLTAQAPDPPAGGGGVPRRAAPQAQDPEARLKAAFEAGLRRGAHDATRHIEDRLAAEAAVLGTDLARRIEAVTEALGAELEAVRARSAEQVVGLAVEIARRVVGDTLSVHPESIVPIVQEALASLVETNASVVLRMHPSDLGPVRAQLETLLTRRRIELQADPCISPGGCLLTSADAAVDATLQARWSRVLASIGRPSGQTPARAEAQIS
jgi:flagellar assembly protein FliH